MQLHKIKGELNDVFQQLKALASGEIEDIEQREYVDIEYHTNTPPQPNLRQQFEDALPQNRYRLVRISRQYLNAGEQEQKLSHLSLEPPTPEKLFQQIWEKQGYANDDEVFKDFQSLIHEAQKRIENEFDV